MKNFVAEKKYKALLRPADSISNNKIQLLSLAETAKLTLIILFRSLKRAFTIFPLGYYSFSNFCLPLLNIFVLTDIPKMYCHCKAKIDNDMTPLGLIACQLVNIDVIFDQQELR